MAPLAHSVARGNARTSRTECPAARGHYRQSIGQNHVRGGPRGYDGVKKVTGRKRHVLVDTQGLVLHVGVHPADRQDRTAIPLLLEGIAQQFPQIEHVWVDQGYMGSGRAWIEEHLGWHVEVVKHASPPRGHWLPHSTTGELSDLSTVYLTYERFKSQRTGFRGVFPRRWVVERSFGWIGQSRRLSKDYERLTQTGETWIYIVMSRLMLRRLTI